MVVVSRADAVVVVQKEDDWLAVIDARLRVGEMTCIR